MRTRHVFPTIVVAFLTQSAAAQMVATAGATAETQPASVAVPVCAAAAAALGAAAARGTVKVKYDAMTDTTSYAVAADTRLFATMQIVGLSLGKAAAAPSTFRFLYAERQPNIAGREAVTTASANYNSTTKLLLLADDTVRIALEHPTYATRAEPAFLVFLVPADLTESLSYPLSLEQLAQLGRARTVRIRMGGYEGNLGGGLIAGTSALYRAAVCTAPIKTASAPRP